MKKDILKGAALVAFGLILNAVNASAQDATYGPYDGSQNVAYYGTGKKEAYDVAIKISNPALVGKTVKGIVIPFSNDVSAISTKGGAFLTKQLVVKNKVNVADVEVDSFDVAAGKVTVNFAQPYTITSDGIYVGYSVSLNQKSSAVIPVIANSNPDADNFYMHTTSTYRKWGSRASSIGGELALQVIIGGVSPDQAAIIPVDELNAQINTATNYTFSLQNAGNNAINSIDYTYSVAGQTGTNHFDFATPVSAHIGAATDVTFALPNFTDAGNYTLTLTLNKVNGNDVTADPVSSKINVYKILPTKRALLEEYTGTWCGWCPRGFVGLEHMNELLGNDFVGVSYHNGDPMEFVTSSNFPSSVAGFPDAWIDRAHETDAYCGDNYDGHFNIDKTYAERNKLFAPADLTTKAYFTDDTKGYVEVKTNVLFPLDNADNKYQLAYILTADGLTEAGDPAHQDSWGQSNYYPGQGSSYPDDDIKEFVNGADPVTGLTYNFVVAGWSGRSYIPNSLPSNIKGGEANEYTYTFDLSKSVNTSGNAIIQDKSKLHVVTLLIDTTNGQVVNALKSNVYENEATGINGVNDANNDATAVTREYYSIDGKRLSHPEKGINIVRLSNGKTFKAVVK